MARELELEEEIQKLKSQVVLLHKASEEVQAPIPQDLPLVLSFMEFHPQDEDPQITLRKK